MERISTHVWWSIFTLCVLILAGCRDREFDDYYGRPDWLPSPIYQQLDAKGNFKNFLACVDKAGYKRTLSSAGYFTLFAPNDEAFAAFFTQQGISGIDGVDSVLAGKIVKYSLVYNAFEKQRLSDYQSNAGWIPLNAFKRRTAYYSGVQNYTLIQDYPNPELAGRTIKVTASNRNGGYVFGDNNNKYIPYFISDYMAAKNISADDYAYFFPSTPFTGFNVADASVVSADILAENGVIHEINKVILPLPSIDEYINHKNEYKIFRDLMEKYAVGFQTHPEVTNRYKVLTGSNDPVYVKFFSSALGFSPNNENFLKAADNDGQMDGWSMFVPTNEAVNKYMNEVLFGYGYTSLEEMPPSIIADFINAHLWSTTVWPSKFDKTPNTLGEEARFNPALDVIEARVLSNGMLYGTNKAQDADVFRSVFGKAYLDPRYSLMTRFLQRELRSTIISPHVKFTLFLISDEVLISKGHNYNTLTNEWSYNGSPNLAVENWTRMINQHVLITQKGELDDLSGSGIVETYGGELIKFNANTVFAAGNQDAGFVVNIADSKEAFNGKVYYLDELFQFPTRGIGLYIRDLGDAPGKPYQRFYDYLKNATTIYNVNTGDIVGVSSGTFHTFFIPTNEAIDKAVEDGVLPSSINPTAPQDRDKVISFILYHILPKFSIINNEKDEGTFETLYKTLSGESTKITIVNKLGQFTVTDMAENTVTIVPGDVSHVLSNRAILHQIDGYLLY